MQSIVEIASPASYKSGKNMQKIITPLQDNTQRSKYSCVGENIGYRVLKTNQHISLSRKTVGEKSSKNSITNII